MGWTNEAFSLRGRVAVVIGGSSGIGREIALGYRAAGATVAIVGRRRDRLDSALRDLGEGPGAPAAAFAADVTRVDALGGLVREIEGSLGPVDILVPCQGTTAIKPALDLAEAEYDDILDTNTKSVFFSCLTFGRGMVERRSGCIVTIASLAAHNGWARAAAYAASKWAVVGLTQSLAAEWGPYGVRVNSIAPGFFMTELNRDKMAPERKAEAIRRAAMGRMGELEELVGAAIYLASPAARFVSGATLRVDGGYLASGI